MARDGRNGNILWQTPLPTDDLEYSLPCTPQVVLVPQKDFSVWGIDSKTGHTLWKVKLSDKFKKVIAGDNCIGIKTIDEKILSVNAKTGQPQTCQFPPPPPRQRDDMFGDEKTLTVAGLEIHLKSKNPGTPFLIVTAIRGGQPVWQQTLTSVADTFNRPFIATGTQVLLIGKDFSTHGMMLFGIDAPTGRTLYSHLIGMAPGRPSFVDAMKVQGAYAYVLAEYGLYVFDVKTGKRIWHVGRDHDTKWP